MTEPLRTIALPALRSGSTAWMVKNTDVKFVRNMVSNACSVVLPRGEGPEIPAFANSMSR